MEQFHLLLYLLYFLVTFTHQSPVEHQSFDFPDLGTSFGFREIKEVEVWLTVSSLAGAHRLVSVPYQRQIELNWKNAPANVDDWIGLFDQPPDRRNVHRPLERVAVNGMVKGYYRTGIQLPRLEFKNLTATCVKFWVAYVNATNSVIKMNCLKTNPFWMQKSFQWIRLKRITDLIIPGTHNSGSFDDFVPLVNFRVKKYSICQDENIFNQLAYGIRFLDLRVSYETVVNRPEKFWIVHGPIRMKSSVNNVLEDVKKFIKQTSEIVILDFHLFEKGFDGSLAQDRHHQLELLILSHLKPYLVPCTEAFTMTIEELIQQDKRIIISHVRHKLLDNHLICSPADHLWANTDDANQLKSYFDENVCRNRLFNHHQIRAAMTELTAQNFGIVVDRYSGLRQLADQVNRNVTEWLDDGWWRCVNVVATDFFLGNNVVEVTIRRNRERLGMGIN